MCSSPKISRAFQLILKCLFLRFIIVFEIESRRPYSYQLQKVLKLTRKDKFKIIPPTFLEIAMFRWPLIRNVRLNEPQNEERTHTLEAVNKPFQNVNRDEIPPPAVQVNMFNAGRPEIQIKSVHERYLAMSHVWGEPVRWQSLHGMDGEIWVSDEKTKFMVERLPEIVQGEWFWMDVLCIDQRDKAAKVMVPQHIPTISICTTHNSYSRRHWISKMRCCGARGLEPGYCLITAAR